MMQLPSEHSSSWETAIIAILGTVGAGGALKIFAQWQAGKSSIRAETATRIRTLEAQVEKLQTEMANLREEKGRYQSEVEFLRTRVLELTQAKNSTPTGA